MKKLNFMELYHLRGCPAGITTDSQTRTLNLSSFSYLSRVVVPKVLSLDQQHQNCLETC